MKSELTLLMAFINIDEFHRSNMRSLIQDAKFAKIVVKISHPYKKFYQIHKLMIICGPDSSIYNAWNQSLKFIPTKYVTFLGCGDSISGLNFSDYRGFDITFPRNSQGKFFHCGAIFNTALVNRYKFNENYKIIADYEQYLRMRLANAIAINIGLYQVHMEPGGMSYYLSRQLIFEYFMIARRYPMEIPRIAKLLCVKLLRKMRLKK